ncbi:hypothetical protein N7457_004551 [Penicillium paradoxum]|uniref:uncharacterized protein n=1 Tax=Penicillium paradoxum TaxID=176176 RepID=UPI0025475B93|nr:uncharacterized protein N7457_004551 [Penicillium paradoxum]KAJ5782777.1 hypothetical protein N7457_004551 [Penicillium paradoxum]
MPSLTAGTAPSHMKGKRRTSKASWVSEMGQVSKVSQTPQKAHPSEKPNSCTHSSTSHGPSTKGNVHHVADSSGRKKGEITAEDRRFSSQNEYPARFTVKEIQVNIGLWVCLACPSSVSKCKDCKQHEGHEDSLIIGIHGECVNGKMGMRSAIGLYWGYGNNGNVSWEIPSKDSQTKQVAELTACLRALRNATSILEKRRSIMRKGKSLTPLNTFVIKSDSEYLVRSLTEWLPKWKANGWKTCKGVPVANADKFQLIETGIAMLEVMVNVKFWLVPKEDNMEASLLAKRALVEY